MVERVRKGDAVPGAGSVWLMPVLAELQHSGVFVLCIPVSPEQKYMKCIGGNTRDLRLASKYLLCHKTKPLIRNSRAYFSCLWVCLCS